MIPALSVTRKTRSPKTLFAASEKGVWYDPSDLSSMFQDAAGTTAVTAVEQPVGKINDKSGNGNHATQSTDASRPVLSARYNLFIQTEDFTVADWTKTNVTVTANQTTAPNGTTTAELVTTTGTSNPNFYQEVTGVPRGVSYRFSVYLKAGNMGECLLQIYRNGTGSVTVTSAEIISGSGSITIDSGGTFAAVTGLSSSSWTQVAIYGTPGTGGVLAGYIKPRGTGSTVGDTFYVWGADLRLANDGVGLPAYQRVNTSTDYDTTGFPLYLAFDGTDDSLATGSIDFSGTAKATLFAGLRKLSDATVAIVCELSSDWSVNSGTFNFSAPGDASTARYSFAASGGHNSYGGVETYTSPTSNVVVASYDVTKTTAATRFVVRVNGSDQTLVNTSSTGAAGTALANYPLYIGRKNNSQYPFNGRLYGLVVVGKAVNSQSIADTETWLRVKSKAY